jgi:hypothetical protein
MGIMSLMFIAFIGAIILQIYLTKKENKFIGLVLPIISFIGMIYIVVSLVLYELKTIYSVEIDGELLLLTGYQINTTLQIIRNFVFTILIWNIPSYILLSILIFKKIKKTQNQKRLMG